MPGPLHSLRSRVGQDDPPYSLVSLRTVLRDINQLTKEYIMTTETTVQHDDVRTPTYLAFNVVEKAEGEKSRWNQIGAYFAHRDGKGGTLILDSIPIAFDGRIVLREPKPKAE
jgi:hypothetical protein